MKRDSNGKPVWDWELGVDPAVGSGDWTTTVVLLASGEFLLAEVARMVGIPAELAGAGSSAP